MSRKVAPSFGEYAQTWLESKEALRTKTLQLYSYLLKSHILPVFGAARIDAITVQMIRRWHTQLTRRKGLGPATAAKAYRVLHQILATAVDDNVVRENPARVRGAASERSQERQIPTVDQVRALADVPGPRYRAMVLTAAFGCGG